METEILERPTKQFISDEEWLVSGTTTVSSDQALLSGGPKVRLLGKPQHGFLGTASFVTPNWVLPAVQALHRLLNLPANWDSYGSASVSPEIAQAALALLWATMRSNSPVPSVVPTASGGIQLEWHMNGVDLEVELASPIRISGAFEDQRTGEVWDKDLTCDIGSLTDAIARLPGTTNQGPPSHGVIL